jgi:hypothetical protein
MTSSIYIQVSIANILMPIEDFLFIILHHNARDFCMNRIKHHEFQLIKLDIFDIHWNNSGIEKGSIQQHQAHPTSCGPSAFDVVAP